MFNAPFGRPFAPPFGPALSGAVSWWLSGGITASQCVAAYAPKGAASLLASYTNLANPGTNDAAPGVAPTWDVTNGWKFTLGTEYLTTGVIPVSGCSMIVRFANASNPVDTVRSAIGSFTASYTRRYYLAPYRTSVSGVFYGAGGVLIVAPPLVYGVIALAGQSAYRNGIFDGTVPIENGIPNLAVYIGARNNDGVAGSFYYGNIQAIAVYNITLSAAQVLAVTTAMNAL